MTTVEKKIPYRVEFSRILELFRKPNLPIAISVAA